jgi:HAD superfamily hydrolase (TIGR01509 family)
VTAGPRFEGVLFDCDGVLVDSEPITHGVLREMLGEAGWQLSAAECMRIFVGKAVKDERERIEAHTGRSLTDAWLAEFSSRRNQALQQRLQAIPRAVEAVQAVHAQFGGRIACASGADLFKVKLQLEKVGLMRWFDGRIFSGHDLPRSKPHPDVYLAAAAALGLDPRRCAVVEDTAIGVTAGVAAGATVFGYSPAAMGHDAPAALRAAGAVAVFTDMAALPGLLA